MSGYPRPGTAAIRGDLGWQDQAACKGRGDLFFGPDNEKPAATEARERRAKRICSGCPVRTPCLEYAESLDPDVRYHGVFGGFGEKDRESLRRRASQLARLEREEQVA